jgi:hypothetical protein
VFTDTCKEVQMKMRLFPVAIVCLLLAQSTAHSQSQQPLPRYEVAVEFSSLGRDSFSGTRSEPGVGARFTLNLNETFALEGAAYMFPRRCFDCLESGRMAQAVGGVKVGKRFNSWGVFGKARPGVVSFSEGANDVSVGDPVNPFSIVIDRRSLSSFAADVGGVIEFYPSPRIVTRFDIGDTIVHFTRRTQNIVIFGPNGELRVIPITRGARTEHQFQFNASVGFRF